MTAITLPNSGMQAGFLAGESGWDDEMNRNLRVLDTLVNLRVLSMGLNAPPGAPAQGAAYIVGAAPTGAWAGKAQQIAIWMVGDDLTSAWTFVVPKTGWRGYSVADTSDVRFNGTVWVTETSSFSAYSVSIGDGTLASFEVNHMLGTRNVHVTIFRNAAPYDEVLVDIAHTTADKVTISGFTIAPSPNQYTVYVSK